MKNHNTADDLVRIAPNALVERDTFGERAHDLQCLIDNAIQCPETIAISCRRVHHIAEGLRMDMPALLAPFGPSPLLSVQPSSPDRAWGGPPGFHDVGMNLAIMEQKLRDGRVANLNGRYFAYILRFATDVARLDPEPFEEAAAGADPVDAALKAFEAEMGEPFPQDPGQQLADVLSSMATAWEGVTARLLRQSQGSPIDAGLGLLIQDHRWSLGNADFGAGTCRLYDRATGSERINGRFRSGSALEDSDALDHAQDGKEMDLETTFKDAFPDLFANIADILRTGRTVFKDDRDYSFIAANDHVLIVDARKANRGVQAQINNAVSLVEAGIISKDEALLRIEPKSLAELLHPQISLDGEQTPVFGGVAASPGGACGRVVFSAQSVQAYASQDIPCVLVRRETGPEDIRGMHLAKAVVTERGGMTSHAAVIARGLGVPCITGAAEISISADGDSFRTQDGALFREGDVITVDGTNGDAYAGEVPLVPPEQDAGFQTFMSWADEIRDVGIRANADTPEDAALGLTLHADGIGLCRTEHMFFEPLRLNVMREMIFAESEVDRRTALEQLRPMQQSDFKDLFVTMDGLPVCIRLFDPPLHEFLPTDRAGCSNLAKSLGLSLTEVTKRIAAISEFNPMLGMRGVRLGIMHPEIYDMQVRAILEAAIEASSVVGKQIEPEIMIPLVASSLEVRLVKERIESVAAAVRIATGRDIRYRTGVLVETPRAALCANEIAEHVQILSFGTNDLTQMTFGLSRDDVGRFMKAYVQRGAISHDPFEMLDKTGVGELMLLGASRGREVNKDIVLAVCGEHGGDIDTIEFCRKAGFDYFSCSPFRVPIARLSAAQLAVRSP
ncbi:putative PEP-binding protein [Tropicimonas marinistellae]|uniref:putative PEP-binding protein n=1 Tax=Tropicimonas marinistellae TaxID=1739787 RepID=UPI0008298D31|nr:putative PEP-binding protein [Tropicimonas marinistellae]